MCKYQCWKSNGVSKLENAIKVFYKTKKVKFSYNCHKQILQFALSYQVNFSPKILDIQSIICIIQRPTFSWNAQLWIPVNKNKLKIIQVIEVNRLIVFIKKD